MTDDTARREGVNRTARWCESCHGFVGYVGAKDLPRPYRCKLCAIIAEKDAEIAALNGKIITLDLDCAGYILDLDAARAEIAALREAVKDFLCECALVDKFRQYETWQITPWSMDELIKMVEEEP